MMALGPLRSGCGDKSRGAAVVEMALLLPLLSMLLLGLVDSGWLLMQNMDVRHGAREGVRLAALSQGNTASIALATCDHMDDSSNTTVTLAGSGGSLGSQVQATVTKQADTVTGFVDWAFSPPVALSFTATFRLEAVPTSWTDGTVSC